MYPNIVSLASMDEDGYYQNDEADILLNTTTGWLCAALIRCNSAPNVGGGTSRSFFSNTNVGNQGVQLSMGTAADNALELIWAMGTGLAFVTTTITLAPAGSVGKILMPWAAWNGTNFIVGVNGEQFDTDAAATYQNNTDEGMFLGKAIGGAATDLENFGELIALGFANQQIADGSAAEFFSSLYATSERLNDLSGDGTTVFGAGDFDYLITMQRQGHSGLNATIPNLGSANGGTFVQHVTADSTMALRTSPTHWACPVAGTAIVPPPG